MKIIIKAIAYFFLYALMTGCVSVPDNGSDSLVSYSMMTLGCLIDSSLGFLFDKSTFTCSTNIVKDLKVKINNLLSQPYDEDVEDDIPCRPLSFVVMVQSDEKLPLVIGISEDEINAFYVWPIYSIQKIEGGFLIYMCNETYIRRFVDVELYSAFRKAMSEIK